MSEIFLLTFIVGIAYYAGYKKGRSDLRWWEALRDYLREGKE
jgi:hypothetical protein